MTSIGDWQGRVGRAWADHWRRTDRSFSGLTDVLLGQAIDRPFRRALDIGCGAGELALALARRHSGAEVVGLDISEDLIAVARERSGYLGNVFFQQADAAAWHLPGYAPDLLVSRHGVMFFDRPVAAFAHLRDIAAPGGRLVFSCFRSLSDNPWADRILSLLPPAAVVPVDPLQPGPFSLAERPQVEGILRESGWRDVHMQPVDYAFVLGAGEDPLEDALSYLAEIGPAARAMRLLSEDERVVFTGRLRRFLASQADDGLIALRAGAWIVTATAPA